MGENATLNIREGHQGGYQGNHQGSHWNKGKALESISKTICKCINQLTSGTSSSKQHVPQASSQCEADSKEDEDVVGAFSHQCSTISHRVIEKGEVSLKNVEKEEPKPRVCKTKGLMYIDVKINGKPIKAMVDTSATHNHLASPEVECIGLVLEKGSGKVKAINSVAQPIAGVAKSMLIKVGPFEGRTNLSAVQMDDFKLILGLEFLRDTKTTVLPFSDSLMMMGSKPCVIPTLVGKMGEKSVSAMQFSKGFKRNEPSFLCTLHLEEIEEATDPIPKPVRKHLQEFEDVMPEELPRRLPPRRAIDHEIELIPRVSGHPIACLNLS
ncbi:Uncharacterized protein Adt_44403 [Abeliophyllum distichum]|uniref:Aspartic peptidase DDI1-type domain-containing protein n=1 Tax=Abeliophyllum distichum TaxID=126358 RepID=A0ABD1PAQ7_9LAMI